MAALHARRPSSLSRDDDEDTKVRSCDLASEAYFIDPRLRFNTTQIAEPSVTHQPHCVGSSLL
ncbi:hypothetical protein O9929_13405 [Vibrio lentus]|nr:hypothetical protein [Vibrio lentus]